MRGRLGEMLGREPDARITADDVAGALFHPRGYLKAVGPQTEVAILLSKVKSPADRKHVDLLARAVQDRDTAGRIRRIAAGDLVGSSAFVEMLSDLR